MRLQFRCTLFLALSIVSTAAIAQVPVGDAHEASVWRNYRRDAVPFATDSSACGTRAASDAGGMSDDARKMVYESCLTDRGWNVMRVVDPRPTCAPVQLQPAGVDSASIAPLLAELTETLTRRFRVGTPGDSAARLVLTVSDADVRARTQGIYDTRIPLAERLAVAGLKQELPQLRARPGVKAIEFVADFQPRCVAELPFTGAPIPTQQAYFEFQVADPVRPVSGKSPVYPPELRDSHAGGRVLAQFVVDTSGVPDMRTFKVLISPNPAFSAAVRDAVVTMRFAPATIGGRHVRQVVQQPFTFEAP